MGRFDALTQIDTQPPKPTTPPPVDPPETDPKPSSPLLEKEVGSASPQQPAGKPEKPVTSLHANLQAGKDASRQTRKPASLQAGKQVNLQTGKQVMIEKYSSYLTHEYKRELKRIAFESDRSEYEVLMEAVEHYLTSRKRLK